ncbi:MAG TPA: hypothetical protein VGL55_14360 [Steroidobacteraceae bacterium]
MTTGTERQPLQSEERLRTWAGHGNGALCNGCGGSIQEHEIEYEVEMPQGSDVPTLHFHFACYRTWTGRGAR